MYAPLDEVHLRSLVPVAIGGPAPVITPIGRGEFNSVYWVDGPAGRSVLRIAPPATMPQIWYERDMMRGEPATHELVATRTRLPIARVLHVDFSHTRIDRDYVLLEALPGEVLEEPGTSTDARRISHVSQQLGALLLQLHGLTAPACLGQAVYGYIGAHRPMEPQPTWWMAFRLMWHRLLDDVAASGAMSTGETDRLRQLLELHRDAIDRSLVPRLLHMDLWEQNILVDEGGTITGILDFDRVLWGDVEIEFAILDYCALSGPAFWHGYGQRRDHSRAARLRQHFYLLYDLLKYGPICLDRQRDPAAAEAMLGKCHALIQAIAQM